MKPIGLIPLTVAALLLAAQPALADPGRNDKGHRPDKHEKHAKPGKGKGRVEARYERNAPPPWAPAHGYRRGQPAEAPVEVVETRYDPVFEARVQADAPRIATSIGISSGTCNRDAIGTVLGAVTGGVIANQTASDEHKAAATVAGVVIGGIVGNTIGRTMDNRDVQCTGQALERVGDRQTVAWKNSSNGQEYQVTPLRTYNQDGLYCREYVARTLGTTRDETTQNACRNPDGSWRMVR